MSQSQKDLEKKLEQLSQQETDKLVASFQDHFKKCTEACKKPNILVAGITGAGKSSLINSVFGIEVAKSGVGMPVTQHFQKFEPKSKPLVIYDSKGLEWSEHEAFIKETGTFFNSLRKKKDISEHIHVVWYVINCARGRIDPYELELVKKVINPTPVIFILNKADLADHKQIKAIKDILEKEDIPNNKGIHICISNRTTWTQSWCPSCLSDDVFYDEETHELECSECGFECVLEKSFGMEKLVKHTCEILPELAKDAFMYSQQASIKQKNKRAKELALSVAKAATLDSSGNFIKKVSELCAKLFVVWGWPLTADVFKEGLKEMQEEYIKNLRLSERLAIASIDKILGGRLGKGLCGLIGLTMNRGMKRLNEQLVQSSSSEELKNKIDFKSFMDDDQTDDLLVQMFIETAFLQGIEKAFDKFWDLTSEELAELKKHMESNRNDIFLQQNVDEEKLQALLDKEDPTALYKFLQEHAEQNKQPNPTTAAIEEIASEEVKNEENKTVKKKSENDFEDLDID